MCYGGASSAIRAHREKAPPIPMAYDSQFIEQLTPYIPDLTNTKFYGGEPFLIPAYLQIWNNIATINSSCVIEIQTNGSVLTEKIKEMLEKGNFRIGVSLDGITKKTYESIRINSNFDTVMKNLIYFQEYCKRKKIHFNVSTCPMPTNWEEMPTILQYGNEHGFTIFFNTVYNPHQCSFSSLTILELQKIYEIYSTIRLPQKTNIEKINHSEFEKLKKHIAASRKSKLENKT